MQSSTSSGEKKQAGALGSMVLFKKAPSDWENLGIVDLEGVLRNVEGVCVDLIWWSFIGEFKGSLISFKLFKF